MDRVNAGDWTRYAEELRTDVESIASLVAKITANGPDAKKAAHEIMVLSYAISTASATRLNMQADDNRAILPDGLHERELV